MLKNFFPGLLWKILFSFGYLGQTHSVTSVIGTSRHCAHTNRNFEPFVITRRPVLKAKTTFPLSGKKTEILKQEFFGGLFVDKQLQYFLDYPYLVYPAFDYPSIGSDNNL